MSTNTKTPKLSSYQRWRASHPESSQRYIDRRLQTYREDPEYRQSAKDATRKSYRKHMAEDPNYSKNHSKKHAIRALRRDPLRFMLSRKKSGAKQKGIDFDLTEKDLALPEKCPVLGIPLMPFVKWGHPNKPSIDRIDPNKGYIKSNVMIISWKANRLKSNCTDPQDLRAIADYIDQHLAKQTKADTQCAPMW